MEFNRPPLWVNGPFKMNLNTMEQFRFRSPANPLKYTELGAELIQLRSPLTATKGI